jgi:hypothetical protein
MRLSPALVVAVCLAASACSDGPTSASEVVTSSSSMSEDVAGTTPAASTTTIDPTAVGRPKPPAPATVPSTTTTAPPVTVPPTLPPGGWLDPAPFVPLAGVDGVAALTNVATAGLRDLPAVAVKIDNHPKARPQWGLASADVVFEENVESLTRFIAVFHSRLPAAVGPIRSARTGDLDVLAAMNRPVLVWSGGNPGVTDAVRRHADVGRLVNINAFDQGRCFARVGQRRAPHNLVSDLGCARSAAPSAGPARPLWAFDDAYVPTGLATPTFDVAMDGVRVTWTWDPATGTYLRSQNGSPHVDADGIRIAATNVVVATVVYVGSPVDARSPEAQTVGWGYVTVHRDGIATAGYWGRVSATDPFLFADLADRPMFLRSGTTFVELARG